MSRPWAEAAGIVLVCLLVYGNSLEGSFHYDDFHSIVQNPHIRTLANIPDFFTDPGLFSGDAEKRMYRPLLLVTYALNHALGGYEVRGYHLVNLLVHAACSLLVWGLSRQLFGEWWTALFCGLVFAVHPLSSEPVNYISSRSELLMAMFFLGACLAYILFVRTGKWGWYIAALGAGVLALLAKSVAVVLVVALALCDVVLQGKRARSRRWLYYLPFVGAALLYLLFTRQLIDRALLTPVRPMDVQLWTQIKAPVYYLKLLFAPWGLNVEHQFFESGRPAEAAVVGSGVLLVSLAALAWKGRHHRLLAFPMTWSAVVLLPAAVVPLNMLVNERRLYLVLAGLVWICGALSRGRGRFLLYAWVLLLGISTWQRNQVWQDELSLWQDAVERAPQMYRAQTNLGKALQLAGDADAALQTYQRALELDPRHGDAYNNIATIYHQQAKAGRAEGRDKLADTRLDQAIEWYKKALVRYPGYEEIHQNLGDAYAQRGQLEKAVELYEQALKIDDRSGAAWSNYGQTLSRAGRSEQAEQAFWRAVELMPGQAEPYNNLGNIYSARGEFARAVDLYRQALEREPEEREEILGNLGDTYREMGNFEAARQALEQALVLAPDQARLHYYLARVARATGQTGEAAARFERAVQLDPGYAAAYAEWAELLASTGEFRRAIQVFQAALQANPDYSRAWYGLAQSQDQAGQREEAARAYRVFLASWPHQDGRFRQAQERLGELERGE